MKVLILGSRAPAALEWSRAFNDKGWIAYAADSLIAPITRASSSVERYFTLPEAKSNPSEWLSAILVIVKKEKIDLILPTCEEVFYLSWGKAYINSQHPQCEIFTSDFALLNQIHHKGYFAQMTNDWEVAAPETRIFENMTDIEAAILNPIDWVFKPAYSRFATQTLIRPDAKKLQNINPTKQSPWVGQKFISGKEYCSFSILTNGKVTAHACYHPRYRVGRGAGIYFEVENSEPIQKFIEEFGAKTSYTGQVGFDFIQDEQGKFFVIECNPRATSGVHLFNDQRQSLVEAIVNPYTVSLALPTKESRMLALTMLWLAVTKHFYRRHFWRDFQQGQDVIFRKDDFAPLIFQGISLLEIILRSLKRKTTLLSAATVDIEWDGHEIC